MKKYTNIILAATIVSASVFPVQSAHAWGGGGPWGSNMFGMDMGQSQGYPRGYGGYGGGSGGFQPWGSNMFGMDMGQDNACRPDYYGGYYYCPPTPTVQNHAWGKPGGPGKPPPPVITVP